MWKAIEAITSPNPMPNLGSIFNKKSYTPKHYLRNWMAQTSWSDLNLQLFLKSKGKMKCALGTESSLNIEDPKFKAWEAKNLMVMSWLIHPMQQQISKTHLLHC